MNRLSAALLSLVVLAAPALPAAASRGDISPRQIYQRIGPGVVLIMAVSQSGTGEMGTGSIIDEQGHVLTNAHVVFQESTRQPYPVIHIYLKPAKITGDPKTDLTDPIGAKVVSFDRGLDLALLQLEEKPGRAAIVPIGDASLVEAGDPVVAIGHPEQGGLWTLTQGVVSTVIANLGGVQGKDVFQTDASINRGNSGGPLLDDKGSMIGVNTSMARKAKDGLTITSVNFSIKSDVVKGWLAKNDPDVRYTEPAAEAPQPAPVPVYTRPAAPPAPPAPPAPALEAKPEPPAAKPAPAAKPPSAPAAVEPPAARPQVEPPPALPVPKPFAAKPSQPKILTPVKPFRADALIEREISEMEDLGKEMEDEIQKRRQSLGQ